MINVIMNYDLRVRQLPYHAYVVTCRADTFRSTICNQTIVQNPHNVLSAKDHLVQHWPQPALIRRDPSRGAVIETMVYMGNAINLWSAFRSHSFEKRLNDTGVTFKINADPSAFHDYSACDLSIAVRDLTESDFFAKPASKLINAWHAGVPALLGPEPAFQALRRSPLDYIEIRSPDDALRAIGYLKRNPEFYREVVENGLNRAREFTVDRIAAQWECLLQGPIAEGYSRWKRRSFFWKRLVRPVQFGSQAVRNVYEKRKYIRQRDHGFRPMSGRHT